jgi:SagB-type dehydrogenase family enzyme
MGKTSKTQLQLIFILLAVVFVSSLILLIFEMIPTLADEEYLPSPDLKGHLPLSSAINQTKIAQDLRDQRVEIKDIAQILWALQGITHGPSFRTVPSAGATYPLEIFIVHSGTSTLRRGYYRYNNQEHRLSHVSSSYNITLLLSALNGQDIEAVANVSTIFLVLADYSRTTDRYGTRGIQYVHLEVGHAVQNFLLQLTSLNLNSRVIANFTSTQIQNFLDTTLEPLAVLPVGISGEIPSNRIKLKQSSYSNSDETTVEEAIAKRKSTRDYLSGEIPLSVVSDVLRDSTTISYIIGDHSQCDLSLVVGEVEDLESGSYDYFLENNSVNLMSQGDFRSSLRAVGLDQIWIESAQLDVIISVNTSWINQQNDYSLYHRITMYHIGMMAQNVYLKCGAEGLGTVVIGAFSESGTAQLLNISNAFTPIYIIPIGLTAEFFEEPIDGQLALTDLARLSGLLSYIPFYFCLYLSLPMLRRRMKKKIRWLHCIVGSIPLIGVFFHFMVIHGHVQNLWGFLNLNSYFTAVINYINDLFSIPTNRYDLGMLLANLLIPLGIIVVITGIFFAFKLVKHRKTMKTIHKYVIFIAIACAVIHNSLNGTIFASNPIVFVLLNILVFDLYFILYISSDLAKILPKNQISSH